MFHVSAFWKPVYTDFPISTGSVGAGIVLAPGPRCKKSKRTWPPVPPALKLGGGLECHLPVPVGKGFATSASVALETALGRYGFWEAVARAHIAEVISKTGLGDVMAIALGRGLAVRLKPGGPGWGKVASLRVPEIGLVVTTFRGPFEDTPRMLEKLDVEEAFERAWRAFIEGKDFASFLRAARTFSERVGFLDEGVERLLKIEGVIGGYAKKSVVMLFTKPELEGKVKEVLKRMGYPVYDLRIHS